MVQKERLLRLFEQLISFDSPSLGERQICDFIQAQLAGPGVFLQEDGAAAKIHGNCGNLYARIPGDASLPPLLFSAHMDTVEPSRGKRMQTDAHGKIQAGGNTVLGADDCAGIAAILEAYTVLRESGLPHRPLEFLFTVAEEPYCLGIRQLDFSRLQSWEAYVFDLTGPVGDAACQAPTILSFRADFTGRAAHAGFEPEHGAHAIKATAAAIAQTPCGQLGGLTVNIGTVSGGTADNVVPAHCVLTGEIRSDSDARAREQLQHITALFQRTAKSYGVGVQVTHETLCTAYHTDLSAPTTRRFQAACENLGLPARLVPTFGGSDNNHLAAHGINGLVVATGMNNCHSCAEYTTEEELVRAAQLALALMTTTE